MKLLRWVKGWLERRKAEKQIRLDRVWEAYREEQINRILGNMTGYALSCKRCSKLAIPIWNTGNRYKCHYCGHQFVSARHGLEVNPLTGSDWDRVEEATERFMSKNR